MHVERIAVLSDGIEVWRTRYGRYDTPQLIAILPNGEPIVLPQDDPLASLRDLRTDHINAEGIG